MPVPSHLMTGGRFSQIVDLFPCPLLFPSFTSPIPSPLPSIAFISPPLPSPSLPSFLSFLGGEGASEFLDEAYPAKTENCSDVATVR